MERRAKVLKKSKDIKVKSKNRVKKGKRWKEKKEKGKMEKMTEESKEQEK